MRHFDRAMENVRPTVTEDLQEYYEDVESQFQSGSRNQLRRDAGGPVGFQ